jgi:hypothetical protein
MSIVPILLLGCSDGVKLSGVCGDINPKGEK